jgi:phosphotransferase system HPr (HPr) family protein
MSEEYRTDQSTSDDRSVGVVIRRGITIANEFGLCARPAAEFVCAAKGFRSQIWLVKRGQRFSAARIIDVLSASLNCEETATIEAEGPDAEEAVERLTELIREFGTRDRDGTSSGFRRCEDDF